MYQLYETPPEAETDAVPPIQMFAPVAVIFGDGKKVIGRFAVPVCVRQIVSETVRVAEPYPPFHKTVTVPVPCPEVMVPACDGVIFHATVELGAKESVAV